MRFKCWALSILLTISTMLFRYTAHPISLYSLLFILQYSPSFVFVLHRCCNYYNTGLFRTSIPSMHLSRYLDIFFSTAFSTTLHCSLWYNILFIVWFIQITDPHIKCNRYLLQNIYARWNFLIFNARQRWSWHMRFFCKLSYRHSFCASLIPDQYLHSYLFHLITIYSIYILCSLVEKVCIFFYFSDCSWLLHVLY